MSPSTSSASSRLRSGSDPQPYGERTTSSAPAVEVRLHLGRDRVVVAPDHDGVGEVVGPSVGRDRGRVAADAVPEHVRIRRHHRVDREVATRGLEDRITVVGHVARELGDDGRRGAPGVLGSGTHVRDDGVGDPRRRCEPGGSAPSDSAPASRASWGCRTPSIRGGGAGVSTSRNAVTR